MRTYPRSGWAAGMLTALLFSGCAEEGLTPPLAATTAGELTHGQGRVPFDLQKIMEQVHFAYRPRGSAWEGEHSTYKVRVEGGGFSVTPFHYPEGQFEEAEAMPPSPEPRVRRLETASSEPLRGEPVRFGVASVSRGGRGLASQAGPGQVEHTGSLTLARGGVAEHFHNSEAGVEQSWSLARKPTGTGALEVRVPVQSGRFLGETAEGLHFAAGPGGLGVRYSHGTWVDAQGQRTPVPARFQAGSIVLSVPAEVLEASAYPAVLDPTVSPEFGMDSPVRGPATWYQYNATVASNGANLFLVVWEDSRSYYSDIYGARVTSAGELLDSNGIPISTTAGGETSPAVASDGTNFMVVWDTSSDISGARVSSSGTVLDPSGIPISTATGSQAHPVVAHDGINFLVVWEDSRNGSGPSEIHGARQSETGAPPALVGPAAVGIDIYGARVSGTGTVLDPNGIPISTAANHQRDPAVARDGTNFLVVWEDSRSGTGSSDIYGARVSSSGSVLNTNGIAISTATGNQVDPAVAYEGTNFLVVWGDSRSGNSDIYGARVSSTGLVRNPGGLAISTAANDQSAPSVARSGANFLVVWQDYRSGTGFSDVYGVRVSGIGTVLDTSSLAISTQPSSQYAPAVAYDGTNFLVVWRDERNDSPDIYGARVNTTGTVLDTSGTLLSLSANSQYTPSVAHDGTNFLVVWSDFRSTTSSYDIYGVRVDEWGTVLDPGGVAISTASYEQYNPTVAHDGTNFLVVWQDFRSGTGSSDIYGARVSSTGTVLDSNGIPISTANYGQYFPVAAYDGVKFLVVWQDHRSGSSFDIYGTRVSSSGTILDASGLVICNTTNNQQTPAVAYDGANFLVVWEDYRSGTGLSDIYGAQVDSSGMVNGTNGIAISTATNGQYHPAVAHDGTNFLVVWQDERNGAGSPDIYGARVDSAGRVLDTSGIAISTATNSQNSPAVAYDGTNFLVVWEDYRGGTGHPDIYGAQLDGTGGGLDPLTGIAISTGLLSERKPRLTSIGGESSLVVYQATHLSSATNGERVMARLVQFP